MPSNLRAAELKNGYVSEYEFGYQRNDRRVVSWHYAIDESGVLTNDDRAGKVVAYVDVANASFFNFMTPSLRYQLLPQPNRDQFAAGLPISRSVGNPPSDGNGYWTTDKNYSSGTRSVGRRTFQPIA